MPERVWTDTLGDAGLSRRAAHRLLDNQLVDVKAGRRVRVLAVERERQHDAAASSREVVVMLPWTTSR